MSTWEKSSWKPPEKLVFEVGKKASTDGNEYACNGRLTRARKKRSRVKTQYQVVDDGKKQARTVDDGKKRGPQISKDEGCEILENVQKKVHLDHVSKGVEQSLNRKAGEVNLDFSGLHKVVDEKVPLKGTSGYRNNNDRVFGLNAMQEEHVPEQLVALGDGDDPTPPFVISDTLMTVETANVTFNSTVEGTGMNGCEIEIVKAGGSEVRDRNMISGGKVNLGCPIGLEPTSEIHEGERNMADAGTTKENSFDGTDKALKDARPGNTHPVVSVKKIMQIFEHQFQGFETHTGVRQPRQGDEKMSDSVPGNRWSSPMDKNQSLDDTI